MDKGAHQTPITLDGLPEDALALIFCSLPDRSSRKAFFSTCKSLRGNAVAAHMHTLKLNLQDLEDAKQQLQFHPAPAMIRMLWLSRPLNSHWQCASQVAAGTDLMELLSGTCDLSIPTEGSLLEDLEELGLRNCPISEQDAPFFAAMLRARCPKLTSLVIVNPVIPARLVEGLANSATCSRQLSLQDLELATLSASSEPLQAVTIAKMTGLQSLRLYCSVAGKDLGPLCSLRHLRKLKLGPEMPPDTENLGNVLRNCKQLYELGLSTMPEAPGKVLVSSSLRRLAISTLPVTLVPCLVEMQLPNLEDLEIDFLSLMPIKLDHEHSVAELHGILKAFFGPEAEDGMEALSLDRKEQIAQNCAALAALPVDWRSCTVSIDETLGALGLVLDALAPLKRTCVCSCQKLLLDSVLMDKGEMSKVAQMFPYTTYMEISGTIASTTLHEAICDMPGLHTIKSWLCGVRDGSAVAACTAAMLSRRSQPLLFKIVTTSLNGPAPSLLQQASAQVQAFADFAAVLPGQTQVTLL